MVERSATVLRWRRASQDPARAAPLTVAVARFRTDLVPCGVGNSYGAYHELSGRSRPVPPAPWNADDYVAQGNPGGLEAIVPSIAPDTNDAGVALPFVFSNDRTAFTAIDSETGEVTSWVLDTTDPNAEPYVFDVFTLD